jgi:hypothetical protein
MSIIVLWAVTGPILVAILKGAVANPRPDSRYVVAGSLRLGQAVIAVAGPPALMASSSGRE